MTSYQQSTAKVIKFSILVKKFGRFMIPITSDGKSLKNNSGHEFNQSSYVVLISDIPVLKIISVLVIIKYGDNHLSIRLVEYEYLNSFQF